MPIGADADELFKLMDADGDGQITHAEFVRHIFRMLDRNEDHLRTNMHISLHKCLQGTVRPRERVQAALAARGETSSCLRIDNVKLSFGATRR